MITIASITLSTAMDPVAVWTPVDLTGTFTDPGTLDTHAWSIDWGDNQIDEGTVSVGGTVNGSHSYAESDAYTITLSVTDDDGGQASMVHQYLVVYDPEAGFVTGAGRIGSSSGAYFPDPELSGSSNFGFVAQYKNGAFIPTGNTHFKFKVGDLVFHSTSYEWLVVSGAKVQYKGSGTINRGGDYGFLLTAIDGDMDGSGGVDRFRIKIWDRSNGDALVYDNNPGIPDDGDPMTAVTGGNIVIHH